MHPALESLQVQTRRSFLSTAVGSAALASLLRAEEAKPAPASKAKRIIYLFQSGGPAAQELFDYKPLLNEKQGEPLPDEVRGTQRLTGMSARQ